MCFAPDTRFFVLLAAGQTDTFTEGATKEEA